jgi:hypothetical protein
MSDPILEEIWRVREELIKEYGGVEGFFRYVQSVDSARRRRRRRPRRKKAPKQGVKNLP